MKLLRDVLHRNRHAIRLYWLLTALQLTVFLLYGLPVEPFLYASALGLFFLGIILTVDYLRERRRMAIRSANVAVMDWTALPAPDSLAEADYAMLIQRLGTELSQCAARFEAERQDAADYYTAWVHQIKTPIAVMKLKLSDDTPENRALSAELFRIEQYVDMVLQYIRLGSATNDLVVREYPLDELISEAIRKYASQFIEKKLHLSYLPTDAVIITDRKWFVCILEQLISNAIKYTPAGTVTVRAEKDCVTVSDTGIGIAPEDLPRIFEKGFTGQNGRIGQKSSGLGLYLAKKAAVLLSVSLRAESNIGCGSTFTIDYHREP